jgi:XTP/dITP diphosphohydrolase
MRLFIGSGNPGKISDWKEYLPDWEILSYKDLELDKVEVEEGITSLKDNASKKALAWAVKSGEITLSDDTGFFVDALGGFPGVSVKRWGGRFEKEMSHEELLRYLEKETEGLDDLSSYFESAYAIADPSGKVQVFSKKLYGQLDRSLFREEFQEGFSFGAVFKARGIDKTWRQMTYDEKRAVDRDVIDRIGEIVKAFTI